MNADLHTKGYGKSDDLVLATREQLKRGITMKKTTKAHSIEEIFQLVGAAMCNVDKALVQKNPQLVNYAIASLQGVYQICIQRCGIYQAAFSLLISELEKIADGGDDHEKEF